MTPMLPGSQEIKNKKSSRILTRAGISVGIASTAQNTMIVVETFSLKPFEGPRKYSHDCLGFPPMSFGRPPSTNVGFKPSAPDRGSFPLDHFGSKFDSKVLSSQ